jgi:hypothetical protein
MEKIDPQIRHDFINNSLRLEVLSKLICEDLNKNQSPNTTHLNDIEEFLKKSLNLISEIKNHLHTH